MDRRNVLHSKDRRTDGRREGRTEERTDGRTGHITEKEAEAEEVKLLHFHNVMIY